MNLGIIFLIFGLQVVSALIVIFVLKKLLDRELIESALEQFEVLKCQEDPVQLKNINVVGHKAMSGEVESRFKHIAARRFKEIPIKFSTDPSLKGGVLVLIGGTKIDCSLSDRLERLFAPRQ
jgi:F0F1-type ATP synthase delta subunit